MVVEHSSVKQNRVVILPVRAEPEVVSEPSAIGPMS